MVGRRVPSMYCSKCGSPIHEGAQFCASCGTPIETPPSSGPARPPASPLRRARPTMVTLLAVLQFVKAFGLLALGLVIVGLSGGRTDAGVLLTIGGICLAFGLVALVCGHGLWTLRPHGWY